jgi:uracil-DNA glycosylase
MDINIKTDWNNIILLQTTLDYWHKLVQAVDYAYAQRTIFPLANKIFTCFDYFNFSETKVVILGQDPYYNVGQANGLAFSVNDGVKLPKSLINIFKELEQDLGIKRSNGNLTD